MGMLAGISIGIGVTIAGILWFYAIMYNWLWLGLVNSMTIGWTVGFAVLFLVFLCLSIIVVVCLILGYALAFMVASD